VIGETDALPLSYGREPGRIRTGDLRINNVVPRGIRHGCVFDVGDEFWRDILPELSGCPEAELNRRPPAQRQLLYPVVPPAFASVLIGSGDEEYVRRPLGEGHRGKM